MQIIEFLLSLFVFILYLATASFYLIHFFTDSAWSLKAKRPLLIATFSAHLIFISALTAMNGYIPIASLYQIMTMIALTLSFVYLIIEFKTEAHETGGFVISLATLFQMISTIYFSTVKSIDPAIKNWIIEVHILTAFLGYSAIFIAGIYGMLYLILYRQIQSNHFGLLYQRLPNLEIMEKMSYTSIVHGFFFMSVAIVAGLIEIPRTHQSPSLLLTDPKLIGVLIIWTSYGIGLLVKIKLGWNGRKMAILFVAGLVLTFFSITFFNLFSARFH
ncbi:cytochrome c assembly protein [Chloroherpeton thalassium ATCC 35110]|uniref:Cytochrome c assembly protein n=1 Tax=Chloroherpeton thalassium (strain ATCC 35110 / GB-78) TaxID=517418 RepID=B3QWH9_CHLT3|nr:cytochrome c biogenesis protein CcsA [Chloroherpeton thalassium]ACF14739.1 cytochrome c assembly protein [Chloroherpeton thalassium ATCC 35110]